MAQESRIPVFTEQFRLSLLQRRVLVLDGVLDDDNGTVLAAQLLTLADEDPDTDVALWINSPGGSVPSMLAIRDVMRLVPCDVATLAFGIACSAGQFLLSAGTQGQAVRAAALADPHAPGVGRDRRLRRRSGTAGRRPAADKGHRARPASPTTPARPPERIFEDSRHDHWYTAPEARDYGFIDTIAATFGQLMPARKRPFGLRPTAGSATAGSVTTSNGGAA